jgi:hypothetical protein
MKMHEHDQEIIMALAEGTLDDAAAAAATAAIAACVECSADLDLQRLALAALDDVPDVYLTAVESARLHDALKSELVGAKTPPIRAGQPFAWGRWLPVAGVAAVLLVAIVSLPTLFGGGFSDDAGDETVAAVETTAASADVAETTAAPSADALSPSRDDDGAAALEMAAEDLEDSLTATTASAETTTTMAAPETTTSDLSGVPDLLAFLGNVEDLDRAALLEKLIDEGAEITEVTNKARNADPFFSACLLENTTPEIAPTLGIAVDSEPLLLGIVVVPSGKELILVAYVPEDVDETVFATHFAYRCGLVEVLP